MWRTASAPKAWAQCGHPCHQLCCILLGEIVASPRPFSGCNGKPLLLPAAPAGGIGPYMGTRLIRARTATRLKLVSPIGIPSVDIVSICRGRHRGFLKGTPFLAAALRRH